MNTNLHAQKYLVVVSKGLPAKCNLRKHRHFKVQPYRVTKSKAL